MCARRPWTPVNPYVVSFVVLNLFFLLQASPLGSLAQFLPIILIFAIFYFLLFLPMQRQRKQQQKMLTELKAGDQVVTSGGIVGTIVSIEGDEMVLRVKPADIKIQVLRSAVSSLVTGDGKKK